MVEKIQKPLKYLAIMTVLISSGITSVSAQNNVEQNTKEEKTIVVVGQTLDQSLKNLNDCLKRNCPPDQDINASLAHAENLFVEGEYKDARKTIDASLKRNKKHATEYPLPVSDLYRSKGRVLEHLGLLGKSDFAVLKVRDTLKKHLPDELDRVLYAELAIADIFLKDGNSAKALKKIRSVHDKASENGLDNITNFAKLRELNIELSLSERKTRSSALKVKEDILKYINSLEGGDNRFTFPAGILLARADRNLGIEDTTNDLIKAYVTTYGRKRPLLVSSDPINLEPSEEPITVGFLNSAKTSLTTEKFDDRWADIGFYVNENGRVEDIEILRIKGAPNWIEAVAQSIASRVYAPKFDLEQNMPSGQYVVERYSYTSEFEKAPGSNLVVRSGNPIVRRLDLTVYDEN